MDSDFELSNCVVKACEQTEHFVHKKTPMIMKSQGFLFSNWLREERKYLTGGIKVFLGYKEITESTESESHDLIIPRGMMVFLEAESSIYER